MPPAHGITVRRKSRALFQQHRPIAAFAAVQKSVGCWVNSGRGWFAPALAIAHRLERTPGSADALTVRPDDRRSHHGRLLVPAGALPGLSHHRRRRPADARLAPRRRRDSPYARAVLPMLPAECAVRRASAVVATVHLPSSLSGSPGISRGPSGGTALSAATNSRSSRIPNSALMVALSSGCSASRWAASARCASLTA